MTTNIYNIKVEYQGAEELVWRSIEISSKSYLSKLAYTVLATFDTLANHQFFIKCKGKQYEIAFDDDFDDCIDPRTVKLSDLKLEIGDAFVMVYDYGCEQTFVLTFEAVTVMEPGTSVKYPRIVDGKGKGILDDVFVDDFIRIARKNIETGKATHRYTSKSGEAVWDYNDFLIPKTNSKLKADISCIQMEYEV